MVVLSFLSQTLCETAVTGGLLFVIPSVCPSICSPQALPGLKSALPGLESVNADLRPERTDFSPERVDFRPEMADTRPSGEGRFQA